MAPLLLVLAGMLVGAKVLGDLAERVGQPAVLGELLAGVLLGPSALGLLPAAGFDAEFIRVLGEVGVILLLFEIGLETDLREMTRVGPTSLAVAAAGVALPFLLGFAYWAHLAPAVVAGGDRHLAAIFVGATLTATSVGITARVLGDLGQLGTREARIVLGAAVIDDVLGLVILSVVVGLAAGAAFSLAGVAWTLALAIGFLAAAVLLGRALAPRLFDLVDRMRVRHVLVVVAIAFALAVSALAAVAGSAMIIGAFAAGLVLSGTNQFDAIEERVRPVAAVFTPFFFVGVGGNLDLGLLDPRRPGAGTVLTVAAVLTLLAIAGKVAAGWAAPWDRFRRLVVGVGMVPRGEVGLIFAEIGRRAGVLSTEVFGAVLLMVMATTFVAPPALKALFGRPVPGEGR
ncbi:MAG TPA: cation:proton antiporter [Gemmatimonadales bacterium]|nr:cation:proton antiporter [Gemmatimonadales bacterium]